MESMSITVKRLKPERDTLRRLYLLSGNQCAFPECEHPIITEGGTYVGELCHICAALEGGERFDPTQTNEERRQFENLLLMCHDHHIVTNDVAMFPVERMHQIKADHELKFERGLSSMMESDGIQITGSTISLGGEGGKAPGAGGGGGGAIGSEARGGKGGSGGKIWDLSSLNFTEIYDALQNEIDDNIPGAGGGGSSAIGDCAIGGDGGGGGDAIQVKFDWTKLKRIGIETTRVRVGKGGSVGRGGQPSGIDFLDDRGNVIISLNAPGGIKGGGSEILADQFTTQTIVTEERPVLLSAMLANSMELREGLLYILGGGWSRYICPHTPYDTVWPVMIQVVLWNISQGESLNLSLVVLDPLQKEVLMERIVLIRDYSDSPPVHIRVLPLYVSITKQGLWRVLISSDTQKLADIPIEVIDSQKTVY